MRISDWSSDVCSSDLRCRIARQPDGMHLHAVHRAAAGFRRAADLVQWIAEFRLADVAEPLGHLPRRAARRVGLGSLGIVDHLEVPDKIGRAPSELQSLMRISYAVFCLKKKQKTNNNKLNNQ